MSFGGGSGGNGSISTSSDVALSNPADGQILAYNATLGKWQNAAGVAKDTANGVAGLDANAHLTYANAPTGSSFTFIWNGSAWTDMAGNIVSSAPTTRTDVRFIFSTTDASNLPTWVRNNDKLELSVTG